MSAAARRAVQPWGAAWLHSATIVALGHGGRVEVRVQQAGGASVARTVRLAQIAGYRPTVGDRVLCAGHQEDEAYAVAVLHAARPPALELDDGTRAEIADDELSIFDRQDRLLLRYHSGGAAEIAAPAGDLELKAPAGKVRVEAATDIELHASRDVQQSAKRRVSVEVGSGAQRLELSPQRTELHASRLEVDAEQSRLVSGHVRVLARTVATTAEKVAANVGDYELRADRIVKTARTLLHDIRELAESRLGRARTLVRAGFDLHAHRTSVRSDKETVIDGERILLG